MDEQQRISAVASSSNSSSMVSSKKYDVFLSFRGEDTRRNFTSHLYKALNEEKVKTYIDDQLEKGDEISPALIKAIEDSRVSIVIFSENYASSKWCLSELSKILECQKVQRQIVIPVFYNIEPSHVRKQTGSYERAFAKHEGEPRCNEWKAALTEAANLAGWDSRNYRTDPKLLKDIVGDILGKLPPRYRNQRKELVGIEEHYKKIESLIKIGPSEVRTLGIWGMGGIGKTTLATALYDKLSHTFEGCCFLANVRGNSDKLEDLRDNSEIRRLRGKKVFIVLDDVATSEQLEKLIVDYDLWEPGSRVIVTTRNKQVLSPVDEIYKVKEMSTRHSLQLFCLAVFGEKQPKDGYEHLSRKVISYCKGIPLALKVLGASFRRRSKEAWEGEIRKLQKIPYMEIHDVLKSSYDSLDCSQKDIFLDIACFFKGLYRNKLTSLLEAFDFFPASGMEVLLDKSLITTSYGYQIEMHDLIQEMGWEIVRQESIKDPGRRSRLWKHEEVLEVLKYNRGTDVVEGIILDLEKLTGDLYLSSDSVAKMTNVRFLKIHNWNSGIKFNVYLPNDLQSLSYKLRYLRWEGFCLESLPSNFCPEQLVELWMPNSKLKKLWDGVQNLVNLKKLDLHCSRNLIEIPDLSKAQILEIVNLRCCESLPQLHVHSKSLRLLYLSRCSSLKEISVTSEEMTELNLSHTAISALSLSMLSLPKLTYLSLTGCRKIERLNVHAKSLSVLRLAGCSSLKEISVSSEQMTELDLSATAICALTSSMLSLPKLTHLCLSGCKEIESVNFHSQSLGVLSLNGCSSVKEISVTSEQMTKLDLSGCKEIESLSLHAKSLRVLELGGYSFVKEISVTSEQMTKLDLSGCKEIESLSLHAKSLRVLELGGYSFVKEISVTSEEMTELNLSRCRKIESLIVHAKSLSVLRLAGCSSLKVITVTSEEMTELNLYGCSKIESLIVHAKSLSVLRLAGCSSLKVITVTSEEITKLTLYGTTITKFWSWIGHLLCLEVLDLSGSNAKSLPANIQNLSTLRVLWLVDCRKLVSLPKLPSSLRELNLHDCRKLVSLPELPPTLYVLRAFNCISLETKITQRLVLQHLLQHLSCILDHGDYNTAYLVFPGDHVTDDESGLHTAENSITIPYLPISHLCGFIYCFILSKGSVSDGIVVFIYQNDIEVGRDGRYTCSGNSISDHMIFWYQDISEFDSIGEVCDHFSNITFIFEVSGDEESLKGCGVFPVYATTLGY